MTPMKRTRNGIDHYQMYIDGRWVSAASKKKIEVENPTSEALIATVQEGGAIEAQRALAPFQRADWGALCRSIDEPWRGPRDR